MIRTLLFSLAVILISAASRAQKPIDFGFAIGPSFSENWTAGGAAWAMGVGVQRPIGNGRFRHHPSLTYGRYAGVGLFFPLAGTSEFDSFSIRYDINVDIIKIKNFSFFAGGGLGMNWSSGWNEGLFGTEQQFKHSAFFNSLLGGIRVKPERGPFGEMVILNAERGLRRGFERRLGVRFEKRFASIGFLQFRIFIPLRRAAKKDE